MLNIIVPVYKAKTTLPNLLNSLVSQTKKMFFTTLVLDADGEDYTKLIEEYRHRGLHLNYLVNKKNLGPGLSRQRGIDTCDSQVDYIMFCDADDMLMPQAVELLTREAAIHNADIVISDITANNSCLAGYTVYKGDKTPVQWLHGKLYRLSYLTSRSIRFSYYRLNEDSYFNLIACNATKNIYYLPKETYIWKDNKNSLTRRDKNAFFEKSWQDYINGQIEGLLRLYKMNIELSNSLVGKTIINIYSHSMKALNYGYNIYFCCGTTYKKLFNCTKFVEQIKSKEVQKILYENLKCGYIEDEKLYLFKYNFLEWVTKIYDLYR